MATATQGAKAASEKFNEGFGTFHQEEIEVGKVLYDAALLIHGHEKTRRLLKLCPAKVFKPLRYGRRMLVERDQQSTGFICVMIDRSPYFGGKASNEHIMVPGRRGWAAFRERVRAITQMPRWADGFTAAAEALDELGYAIAESIAAIRAFGMDSDDDVVIHLRR